MFNTRRVDRYTAYNIYKHELVYKFEFEFNGGVCVHERIKGDVVYEIKTASQRNIILYERALRKPQDFFSVKI